MKHSCCSIKLLSLSSISLFVALDTMLLVGSFFRFLYGPLVKCLLHFCCGLLCQVQCSVALPLSAGRMMMFSFRWGRGGGRGDFKDVDCFL